MICSNCGQNLPDNSKFCMSCGATVAAQQAVDMRNAFHSTVRPVRLKLCAGCNAQTAGDEVYCRRCGSLLQERWLTGKELMKVSGVNFYEKYWVLANANASGMLTVYEDRVFFEKKLGNSVGMAFGLIGVAIAQKKIKEDPTDEYFMRDIAHAQQGDAIIKGSLLTITLKNGESFSFVFPKDKVARAVALIEEYRKYY